MLEDRDNDLKNTTQANLLLKTESNQLRRRLLEADEETSQWRKKFEKVSIQLASDKGCRSGGQQKRHDSRINMQSLSGSKSRSSLPPVRGRSS